MLEVYFQKDARMESMKDLGTAISVTVSIPDSFGIEEPRTQYTITLSDLGVAKALGIEPKEMRREEFFERIREAFPMCLPIYGIPRSEFPIPKEWYDEVKQDIENYKSSGEIADHSYIFTDFDIPLYQLFYTRELKKAFDAGQLGISKFPDLLQEYLDEPEKFWPKDTMDTFNSFDSPYDDDEDTDEVVE